MSADDDATIRTIERRVVYGNAYVTVYDDLVAFPGGARGSYFRARWTAPHGVAVVPVADGRVLLLETYRYAELAWSIEIPQGFGTAGSPPAEDAARELREETGLSATALEPLLDIGRDYVTHAFVARLADDLPSRDALEPTEAVRRYLWLALDEIAPDRLAALGVRDANTLACLFALRLRGR